MKRLLFLFLGCALSSCCVPSPTFSYFSIYNGSDKPAQLTLLKGEKKYVLTRSDTKLETKLAPNSLFSLKTPISAGCVFSNERLYYSDNFTLDEHIYKYETSSYIVGGISIGDYLLTNAGLYRVMYYSMRSYGVPALSHDVSANVKYDLYINELFEKIVEKYGRNAELNGKEIEEVTFLKVKEETD